jgi:hypothetical protein
LTTDNNLFYNEIQSELVTYGYELRFFCKHQLDSNYYSIFAT